MLKLAKLAKPLLVSAGLLVPGHGVEVNQVQVHQEFQRSSTSPIRPVSVRAPVIGEIDMFISQGRMKRGLSVEDLVNVMGLLDAMLVDSLSDPGCTDEEVSKACPPEDELQPGRVLVSFVSDGESNWPADGNAQVEMQLRRLFEDRYPDAELDFVAREAGRTLYRQRHAIKLCLVGKIMALCPPELEDTPKGMFRLEVLMFEAPREI